MCGILKQPALISFDIEGYKINKSHAIKPSGFTGLPISTITLKKKTIEKHSSGGRNGRMKTAPQKRRGNNKEPVSKQVL